MSPSINSVSVEGLMRKKDECLSEEVSMDTIMRIWVLVCILLFTMRQFLPSISQQIDVISMFGIAFALLVASAFGAAAYRNYREGAEKRSVEHQS
jgi:hypothetical protein